MPSLKIFADGGDPAELRRALQNPVVQGVTTNPTLMRKAGVTDYEASAREIAAMAAPKPVSLEVLSDDFDEMEAQALRIASWGGSVYVKIPVTDTRGVSAAPLIARLAHAGVKVNVTALMSLAQVDSVLPALRSGPPACVSLFAGRIADTGRDPAPVVRSVRQRLQGFPNVELIWASSREIYNVVQAGECGCHIITLSLELLRKLEMLGRDLDVLSLDTVRMFVEDGRRAGYRIGSGPRIMSTAAGKD